MKGVFSLEESLDSLKSLNSLESLENGRLLLYFPGLGDSLRSLESLNSLESLEMDFSEKTPFPKDPFFRTRFVYAISSISRQAIKNHGFYGIV